MLRRAARASTAALALAACGGGGPRPPDAAPAPSSVATTPSWCARALEEVGKTDATVDRVLAPHVETSELDAIAKQLAHEADRLELLAAGAGIAEVWLRYAASGSNKSSGVVYLLESRKLGDAPEETPAIERALYVALQHRRRAVHVLHAFCAPEISTREATQAFRVSALAGFPHLRELIQPCRALAMRAGAERPGTIELLVHVHADGRPWLVAPAVFDFEPGEYALTDAVECLVRRLETTSFPPPKSDVTLSIPIELPAAPAP
ncbi:MAG: hypothetical protein JWM74_1592 [Myxococcaceae bacterium]|nr:hypothetical protein [Myxococcaceae bacterium]